MFSLFTFILEVTLYSFIRIDYKHNYLFIIGWSVVDYLIISSYYGDLNFFNLVAFTTLPLCRGKFLNEIIKDFNHISITLKAAILNEVKAVNLFYISY